MTLQQPAQPGPLQAGNGARTAQPSVWRYSCTTVQLNYGTAVLQYN